MPTEIITLLNGWQAAPVGGPTQASAPAPVQCRYCLRLVAAGKHETTRGGHVRCYRCAAAYREDQRRLAEQAECREYGYSGGHHANEWSELRDRAEYAQEMALEGAC